MKITFDLTVKAPQAHLTAEDTLMALLNYKYDGITFREALYYAIAEGSLNPEVDGRTYNLSKISNEFLNWSYWQAPGPAAGKEIVKEMGSFKPEEYYSLFIYNESSHQIRLIAGQNDFTKFKKDSVRVSTPLSKDIWIVYYSMIPSFKYE